MSVRILCALIGCLALSDVPVEAQLVEPGKDDQFAGVFLYKPTDASWVGAVASQGSYEFADRLKNLEFDWQFDYGSLGARKVTPTDKPPLKEADVSKNSGEFALTYNFGRLGWDAPMGWRVGLGAGVEHSRTQESADEEVTSNASATAGARLVLFGSRKLLHSSKPVSGGQSDVTDILLTWSIQPTLQTADALASDGSEGRHLFFDPAFVTWLSLLGVVPESDSGAEPTQFFRFVLKAAGAAMQPLTSDPRRANWDVSATCFFTRSNGVMVRHFAGYFDHNLRDRKQVTSVMLIWKFA